MVTNILDRGLVCACVLAAHPRVCRPSLREICQQRHFSQTRHRQNGRLEQDKNSELQFPLDDATFEELRNNLLRREPPVLYDTANSTPSSSLYATLADFLPLSRDRFPSSGKAASKIPIGRHLIHFPPQSPLSELLPDGTDPLQSPGKPFNKRMWAGGRIRQRSMGSSLSADPFAAGPMTSAATMMEKTHSACREKIVDVKLKGSGNNQKIFVTLERRVGSVPAETTSDDDVRHYLDEVRNCSLIERRDLVFLRPSSKPAGRETATQGQTARQTAPKTLASPGIPDYSVALLPSQSLLFRFSALTFNAHHIHLDKTYCREVEGLRNLLVHGPLSCVMMLETLRMYLDENGVEIGDRVKPGYKGGFVVQDFVYRNLAPVFAEEEMKVCLRFKERMLVTPAVLEKDCHPDSPHDLVDIEDLYVDPEAEGVESGTDNKYALFDCWVENSEGRMCVRGTAYCRLIDGPSSG